MKLNNILFFLDFFLPISLFRFQHKIKLKIFFIVLHTFLPTSMTSKKQPIRNIYLFYCYHYSSYFLQQSQVTSKLSQPNTIVNMHHYVPKAIKKYVYYLTTHIMASGNTNTFMCTKTNLPILPFPPCHSVIRHNYCLNNHK